MVITWRMKFRWNGDLSFKTNVPHNSFEVYSPNRKKRIFICKNVRAYSQEYIAILERYETNVPNVYAALTQKFKMFFQVRQNK